MLTQLTLSPDHYTYVAPHKGAPFEARVATPGRHVKVHLDEGGGSAPISMRSCEWKWKCWADCHMTHPASEAL